MFAILLVVLLLIGAVILVAIKVSNKLLKYSIITILSALVIGLAWIMYIAVHSGEM